MRLRSGTRTCARAGVWHLGSRFVFDPFNPPPADEAVGILARMRGDSPVVDIADGMRYVTRHAECRDVLRDTATFSNASGMKAPGVVIPMEDRLLGELDPPRHTLVRRVMVTALAPKVVHGAEPFMHDDGARGCSTRSAARPQISYRRSPCSSRTS